MKWLYKSESFLMVYLSVVNRLVIFSPSTLTDPVPVTAKKKMHQTVVIFWEEDGHFFHVFMVLK